MRQLLTILLCWWLLWPADQGWCQQSSEQGGSVLAVASGEVVTLIDVNGGVAQRSVRVGTVPRLYPGPGGVLFAPDFAASRTAVVDVRSGQVRERLDGLTMPVFGTIPDRYVVVAGEVLVVSYPDRSVLAEVDAGLNRPWRTVVGPDERYAMVLERAPSDSMVTIIDLWQGLVQSRHPVRGSVADMELLVATGALALGADDGRVLIVDPATFAVIATWQAPSGVRTLVAREKQLVVGCADGSVTVLEIKVRKQEMRVHEQHRVQLSGAVHAAAGEPGSQRLAVVTDDGVVTLIDAKSGTTTTLTDVEDRPRDLVWVDLSLRGPLEPLWSDGPGGGPENATRSD